MNAAEYIKQNYPGDQENFKASAVHHMMDLFAWLKVSEFRRKQFAPVREEIITNIKLIPTNTVIGMPVFTFIKTIDSRSDDEVIRFVKELQEVVRQRALAVKELFGASYCFFRDLKITVYEYNPNVHPAANGNEGRSMQQVSETAQARN